MLLTFFTSIVSDYAGNGGIHDAATMPGFQVENEYSYAAAGFIYFESAALNINANYTSFRFPDRDRFFFLFECCWRFFLLHVVGPFLAENEYSKYHEQRSPGDRIS